MSEFVEEYIEGLLPVFETLKGIQLLSGSEVDAFIKRCQFFEYRIQKSQKISSSFTIYTSYLKSALEFIRIRRKRLNNHSEKDRIEDIIKAKIVSLLRGCCEKFKLEESNWLQLIAFTKEEKMYVECSNTYSRMLQIFPRNVTIRIQAARFEYSVDHRIECSRCILQEGIRICPLETKLWASFVKLELDYVKWLITRKSILVGEEYHSSVTDNKSKAAKEEKLKDKNVQDAILNFQVIETIIQQALTCCEKEKKPLLLIFWRISKKYGSLTSCLTKKLYEMLWSPNFMSEESWIAKSQMISNDRKALYKLFDKACANIPTEKMYRHCLSHSMRYYIRDRDPEAKKRCHKHLFWLIIEGHATESDVVKFNQITDDIVEKENILNKLLKNNPKNAFFWMMLLHCKIESGSSNAQAIREVFNEATKKASDDDYGLILLYREALNWAYRYSPKDLDEFYEKACFRAPPKIASIMRCFRLNYLADQEERPDKRRKEYFNFTKHPPNCLKFHRIFIQQELQNVPVSIETIVQALELMIAEFGSKTYECWIDYCEVMLKYQPTALPTIHRRAVVSVPPDEVELFLTTYGDLLHNS